MPSAATDNGQHQPANQDEKLFNMTGFIEKKIRNLDKRKNKLESYKKDIATGKSLAADQTHAVASYDTVVTTLELCRDIVTQLKFIINDRIEEKKHETKRRNETRVQHDQDRLTMALRYQDILERLHDEKVREDFLTGSLSAVKLDETKLQQLLDLELLISMPTGERSLNHLVVKEQNYNRAHNLGMLLDGSSHPFQDTTFKNMKALLNAISACPYPRQPKPKKEIFPPYPTLEVNQNKPVMAPVTVFPQHPLDFNQGDIMANGYQVNAPMNFNPMMSVQPAYYNQNQIPPMEIRDLMISSNINFIQDSQVNPEPTAVYMDPAVVSFGTIQPESLMQMHEPQIVHQPPPPVVSPPVIRAEEPQMVYQPESIEERPTQVELPAPQPEPVITSWADESNDRWPNEINGESNVWNGKPTESTSWADEVDDRRSFRGKPSTRRSNFGGGYRGRGNYTGSYTNGNRGNSFGSNGYRGRGGNGNVYKPRTSSRGNGAYNRGTSTYRGGYRGGYQSQQQQQRT